MEVMDNISTLLGDDLKGTVRPGAKVRIAASSFSIYAFEALRQELENVEALRIHLHHPYLRRSRGDRQGREKLHGSSISPKPAGRGDFTVPSLRSG